MSISSVRRPLSVAAPSGVPPVFAVASNYEPRSIPAQALPRERRGRGWIAIAAIAVAALFTFGLVGVLLYRHRSPR